jgi:RNA-binding protein YlmH
MVADRAVLNPETVREKYADRHVGLMSIRYNREFRTTHGQDLSGHWLPDRATSEV